MTGRRGARGYSEGLEGSLPWPDHPALRSKGSVDDFTQWQQRWMEQSQE